MKTIVILFLILGTSIILRAQIPESNSVLQKKEFGDFLKNDSTDYFSTSPKFKSDTFLFKHKNSEKFDINKYSIPKSIKRSENLVVFNMPIAGYGSYSMNMPVMVPDSSVHYYIKEKRIHFLNPKEKK